jgi:hypothetical protein
MAKKTSKRKPKNVVDDLIGEVKAPARRGRPPASAKALEQATQEQATEATEPAVKVVKATESVSPIKKLGAGFIANCPIHPGNYGDKNPQVVEWLNENNPTEFKKRYQGRRTHLSGGALHDFSN